MIQRAEAQWFGQFQGSWDVTTVAAPVRVPWRISKAPSFWQVYTIKLQWVCPLRPLSCWFVALLWLWKDTMLGKHCEKETQWRRDVIIQIITVDWRLIVTGVPYNLNFTGPSVSDNNKTVYSFSEPFRNEMSPSSFCSVHSENRVCSYFFRTLFFYLFPGCTAGTMSWLHTWYQWTTPMSRTANYP